LGFMLEDLAPLFKWLDRIGLGFIIIGDTCVYYAAGHRVFQGDVDLYIFNGSISFVENDLRKFAEESGWDIGSTELGTPSLVLRKNDEDIAVDLYEAMHDFYVPAELIESSRVIDVGGLSIRILSPEQHIVLKARSGSEDAIAELSEYLDLYESGDLSINIQEIRRLASLFEDQRTILYRLRKAGFQI